MEKVDHIKFGTHILDVYGSDDKPFFSLSDVAETLDIKTYDAMQLCEEDELTYDPADATTYVDEHGLYNILAQNDGRINRMWRRVIFDQLIEMRKSIGRTVNEQFVVWDRQIDDLYFDEESGKLMRSVTVPGGDVIQVPAE